MPIYEYKCKKCGNEFELLQSFSAEKLQKCSVCGADAERKLSLGSFVLKGGGWYATSQRNDPKPAETPTTNANSCPENCKSCPATSS